MARKTQARGPIYLIAIGVVAAALTAALLLLRPYGSPFSWLARGAALLGYLAVFFSILSSAYIRWLVGFFGRPFIRVHHVLSISGLILIGLHPVGVMLDWGSARVLFPRFDSLRGFLQWGGPPALYLIGVASLTAALRRLVGKPWRAIHFLNYIAFLLATFHATMLGTEFTGSGAQSVIARILAILMAVAVVATFVQKRLPRRR
jgi:DMSO/TMAO reductase YedYZ heme-binding membrane subunit